MTTTPTVGDALLADILEHPGDDAPRLIYADWLDEQGQEERADFIRVQVALATPAFAPGTCACQVRGNGTLVHHCELCALRCREKELLAFVGTYTPYVVPNPAIVLDDWTFRRGFVAEVSLPWQSWKGHGPAILQCHPIERVRLSDALSCQCRFPEYATWHRVENRDNPLEGLLPGALFDLLEGGELVKAPSTPTRVYESRDADADGPAYLALSAAALKWARGRATAGGRPQVTGPRET